MKSTSRTTYTALTLVMGSFLMATQAVAATVGFGVGRTNEFRGSDDFVVIPLAAFEVETPIGILKNNEVGAQLDIIKSGSLDTGPILRFNGGRNDSVGDDVIAALPEIEGSPEAGWFIGSGFKLSNLGVDSNGIVIGKLSAVTDVGDGHGGTVVNASVGLVLPVDEQLRFIPSLNLTYGDDNYTNAFYGVSAESAAESSLTEFTASGGLETAQVALVAIRGIDEHWSVTGTVGYAALQGDAAKSSIAARGSDRQLFTGFIVNYEF